MSEPSNCQYFVKRKKRYCRMTVKQGANFCGEHLPQGQETTTNAEDVKSISRKRVLCPLDPTHTCYATKLTKHLKVCNVKQLTDVQPDYIVKGINSGYTNLQTLKHVPLSQLDESTLNTVLKKINAAYEKIPEIPEVILTHSVLEDELSNVTYGKDVRKHLLQNSSLIAHLQRANLLQDDTCFIEFGAGKGKLTYWLAQAIKEQQNSAVMLVDRSSHRHKSDNKLKNETNSLDVIRIRADIADLSLSAVREIENFRQKVGIAKHLCGVATDLTMRCLIQAMYSSPEFRISGMVVAFCCHHRCEYAPYVGHDYLAKTCEFLPEEFSILCSIASWATCGSGKSRTLTAAEEKTENEAVKDSLHSEGRQQKRETIGRKVKTILNWGRVEYLKTAGFNCELVNYISTDISLENMCIIATRKVMQ
ncbi:tRNA:m(4)X modification enzyme TRM13 homolog [Athalia rosae]|uniref:tRNA:m(4)X modification enzyme TRM13 homolog n=1 Tax=Athalia rosae TaxID=37344 RepID=UPI0020348E51|nr:tRNA:m(4)X modification enzyme TRM13 homolog [Athalia rosae]XP_048508484.1 tRNA:m(4)X modification enzyme TRM13 homolog [Athalia rosae]